MSYNMFTFVASIIRKQIEKKYKRERERRGEKRNNNETIGWEKEYFSHCKNIFSKTKNNYEVSIYSFSCQLRYIVSSVCSLLYFNETFKRITHSPLFPRYFIAAFLLIGENISYNEILDCECRFSKVFKLCLLILSGIR